jgi:hypothetical protein
MSATQKESVKGILRVLPSKVAAEASFFLRFFNP